MGNSNQPNQKPNQNTSTQVPNKNDKKNEQVRPGQQNINSGNKSPNQK